MGEARTPKGCIAVILTLCAALMIAPALLSSREQAQPSGATEPASTTTTTSRTTTTPRTTSTTRTTTTTPRTTPSEPTSAYTPAPGKPSAAAVERMEGTWHPDQIVLGSPMDLYALEQVARFDAGKPCLLDTTGYEDVAGVANVLVAGTSITFYSDGTGRLSATIDGEAYDLPFSWDLPSGTKEIAFRWGPGVKESSLPEALHYLKLLRYDERLHVSGLVPSPSGKGVTSCWFSRREALSLPDEPQYVAGTYALVATFDSGHGFDLGYDTVVQEIYEYPDDYFDYDYEDGDAGDLEWILPSLYMSTATVDSDGMASFAMHEAPGLDGAGGFTWVEPGFHAVVTGAGGETYHIYELGEYVLVTSQDGFEELKRNEPLDKLSALLFKLQDA